MKVFGTVGRKTQWQAVANQGGAQKLWAVGADNNPSASTDRVVLQSPNMGPLGGVGG